MPPASIRIFLTACGSKQIFNNNRSTFTKNEIIAFQTDWLKDKGDKFDIELRITNISNKDIIVMLGDMSCSKGSVARILKHTLFNTGERTIDFRKGQMKQFRMVCDYGMRTKGDYKIVIRRIYDNPNADGALRGETLGSSVEWSSHQ